MSQYLMIQAAAGEPAMILLDEADLRRLLADPDEHGVTSFLHGLDSDMVNPSYWIEGATLLLRIEILKPVQVQAYVLPELDAEDKVPEPAMNRDEFRAHVRRRDERLTARFASDVPGMSWVTGHGVVKVEDFELPDAPLTPEQ